MKKQILFLTLFTLALIFAGTSKVSAQLGAATQAIPALSCAGDAQPLHPASGVSYTYEMDGTTGAEQADQWTWWATKDISFIAAGALNSGTMLTAPGDLLSVGANYGIASGTNSIDIEWSPEILAQTVYQGAAGEPTFVVGYATGALCADNIQVYEINPVFNFVVDIANIDESGTTLAWDAPADQCVSPVESATYNGTTFELDMDYGTDTLYFEVSAANFVNDWTPTFRLNSGLVGTQTADVGLASSLANAQAGTFLAGATTSWTAASVGTDWATGVALDATLPGDVVGGVSVFVRVVISNLTEESLTDNLFSLAVDAIDDGGAGQWDLEDLDCTTPTDAADQVDVAEYTVTPRPTIIHSTVDTNPTAPNDVITKTP